MFTRTPLKSGSFLEFRTLFESTRSLFFWAFFVVNGLCGRRFVDLVTPVFQLGFAGLVAFVAIGLR